MAYKEFSFPFDSWNQETGEMFTDEDGFPDRLYGADDFARKFSLFFSDGVFPNPADNLKVEANDGNMYVTLKTGSAFMQGRSYVLYEDDMSILVPTASLSLPRTDIIVLWMEPHGNREIKARLKKGVPSADPKPPDLTRDADTYEMKLAEIYVSPGTQIITQADVLDTRMDAEVCGVVTGIPERVDTTDLFNQYDTYLKEKIKEWETFGETNKTQWQALFDELVSTTRGIETLSFVKINNNFDDWSTKRGAVYKITFLENGDIEETIKLKSTDYLIAKRKTDFLPDENIEITVNFYNWTIEENGNTVNTTVTEIKKTTIFNADGSITEEVY